MAIAVVTSGNFEPTSSGTSRTLSLDCGSAADRDVVVAIFSTDTTPGMVSVTAGGVSGVEIDKQLLASGWYIHLWNVIGPPTGTQDIIVTQNQSTYLGFAATSLSGVAQTGQTYPKNKEYQASSGTVALSVTTDADNSWTFMVGAYMDGASISPTGITYRRQNGYFTAGGNVTNSALDSNSAIATAGSTSLGFTGGSRMGAIMFALRPAVAAGATFTPKQTMII